MDLELLKISCTPPDEIRKEMNQLRAEIVRLLKSEYEAQSRVRELQMQAIDESIMQREGFEKWWDRVTLEGQRPGFKDTCRAVWDGILWSFKERAGSHE